MPNSIFLTDLIDSMVLHGYYTVNYEILFGVIQSLCLKLVLLESNGHSIEDSPLVFQ